MLSSAAKSKNIDLDLYGISLINIDGIKNLPYPFHVVRNLNLPYTIILDKDYFIPYLNDELDSSRNSQGLPKYRFEFKNGILLNDLIQNQLDQNKFLKFIINEKNGERTLNNTIIGENIASAKLIK